MSNKAVSVYADALKRQAEEDKSTRKVTQVSAPPREPSRVNTRQNSRENGSKTTDNWPSRDDIQGFSFRLRDELKVKVQAEVPHYWQRELDDLARELDVKKLELYRFIIGEFLGKVTREP